MNPATAGLDREAPRATGIERYELESWGVRWGIVAGVTGRGGGYDLGLWSGGAAPETVRGRWRGLLRDTGFPGAVVSRQVHGAAIARHRRAGSGLVELDGYDGHVADADGLLLCVTVADCVPVYLVDRTGGGFGIVHAGWRGIAAGVVERGIEALREQTGCAVTDIAIHCGVSICGDCYEVGREVVEALATESEGDGRHADLRAVVARRARALGVDECSRSAWCTAHDGSRFFSHRRSGGADGRQVAYIGRVVP